MGIKFPHANFVKIFLICKQYHKRMTQRVIHDLNLPGNLSYQRLPSMHEAHARIYPNDKRKRHLAHTVIRKVVGCHPFGYRLLSVQRLAVIRMLIGYYPFGYRLLSVRLLVVIRLGINCHLKGQQLSSVWMISQVLMIIKNGGQERYRTLNRVFYKKCHVVFMVYSVDNRRSFEEIKEYYYNDVINTCKETSI